jgi:hypothetical protein
MGEPVNVWGNRRRVTIARKITVPKIIGKENQNVRARAFQGIRRTNTQKRYKEHKDPAQTEMPLCHDCCKIERQLRLTVEGH